MKTLIANNMNHNYKTHKLKSLRKGHGFTQLELSRLLGVNSNSIGKLEKGTRHPSSEVLLKLKIIFDRPDKDFIPEVLEKAMDHVWYEVQKLKTELIHKVDRKSKRKLEMLDSIASRISLNKYTN